MSGIQQMLIGAGGAGVVVGFSPLVSFLVTGSTNGGAGTSAGSCTFNTTGSISISATPILYEGTAPTAWCTPTGGVPGMFFYIRATLTSGTFTTGPASGVWTPLSSAVTWTKSGTTGGASATFTIDIAGDAAGTNILFTRTGNVIGFNHAPI